MEKAHRETIEALAVAITPRRGAHEPSLRVQIYAAGVRDSGMLELRWKLEGGALLHEIGTG